MVALFAQCANALSIGGYDCKIDSGGDGVTWIEIYTRKDDGGHVLYGIRFDSDGDRFVDTSVIFQKVTSTGAVVLGIEKIKPNLQQSLAVNVDADLIANIYSVRPTHEAPDNAVLRGSWAFQLVRKMAIIGSKSMK
jgi:hypothetical protein